MITYYDEFRNIRSYQWANFFNLIKLKTKVLLVFRKKFPPNTLYRDQLITLRTTTMLYSVVMMQFGDFFMLNTWSTSFQDLQLGVCLFVSKVPGWKRLMIQSLITLAYLLGSKKGDNENGETTTLIYTI